MAATAVRLELYPFKFPTKFGAVNNVLKVLAPVIVWVVFKVTASVIPYPPKVVGLLAKLAKGTAIFALPSKLTPAIVRAVCKVVAVVALPVNAPVKPKLLLTPFVVANSVTVPNGVDTNVGL